MRKKIFGKNLFIGRTDSGWIFSFNEGRDFSDWFPDIGIHFTKFHNEVFVKFDHIVNIQTEYNLRFFLGVWRFTFDFDINYCCKSKVA